MKKNLVFHLANMCHFFHLSITVCPEIPFQMPFRLFTQYLAPKDMLAEGFPQAQWVWRRLISIWG